MDKLLMSMVQNNLEVQFYVNERTGIRARLPKLTTTATARSKSLYDDSFSMNGPRLWNALPKDVTSATTLYTFKKMLNEYLRKIPDKPPDIGYSLSKNNSITNYTSFV